MMVIGVVEDARVEQMAIHSFPGLAPLWRKLHHATPDQNASVGDYLNRIARALLDPDYADPDPLIAKARSLFAEQANRLSSNQLAWEIGVTLAHDLMQMQLPFVHTEVLSALYRDDNRYLWDFKEESDFAQGGAPWQDKQVRKHVSVMEFANEVEVETAGDDAQEIWVLSSELFPYEDLGKSYNELEGKEPPPQPHPYPEWDYQMQLERPAWCTVLEKRPKQGEVKVVDEIVVKHKPIIGRLRHLIEAMQPQGVQRLRKQEDGDEIDLNAAVHAMVEMRMGEQPDPRIMIRNVRKVRDLSVLLLIDLSESTNDPLPDSDNTVLQLAREATVLLADALDKIGDPFAIHGFDSNGRHDVAFEIVEALGTAPAYHVLPVGNAGNISAHWSGYCEASGVQTAACGHCQGQCPYHGPAPLTTHRPVMVGYQAAGSAPFMRGGPVAHPETIATAIRIGNPMSWSLAWAAVRDSGGWFDECTDAEILAAQALLARTEGIFCEPSSATSLAGLFKDLKAGRIRAGSTIVATLTGHGLKDPDTAIAQSQPTHGVAAEKGPIAELIGKFL